MPFLPFDHPTLAERLRDPDITLVVCLCANWCGTCREYQPKLEALAERLPANHVVTWLDIEDQADLLGDEDIENFPTLWIEQGARLRFYGTMLPQIGQLEDLLSRLQSGRYEVTTDGPDLRQALMTGIA